MHNRTAITTNLFSFFPNSVIVFYLQDRYVKTDGSDLEPVVDPSQDYVLISGYENATHTVLRFKRKLDTCDTSYDLPISVSESPLRAPST